MIKLENVNVSGWETAVRGMRNPMNSWDKSDSEFVVADFDEDLYYGRHICEDEYTAREAISDENGPWFLDGYGGKCVGFKLGEADHDLMMKLAKAGSVEGKFRRMITVTLDITAPLYWWKEFDTYKVGTVANSCSTMHKIHSKEFTLEDFSCEHLINMANDFTDVGEFKGHLPKYDNEYWDSILMMELLIKMLNFYREKFLETKDKRYWWQMIQLLPTSYNQKRTVQLNYEVLANIYRNRKDHKLDEWREFCKWIETLPYSELITLEESLKGRFDGYNE